MTKAVRSLGAGDPDGFVDKGSRAVFLKTPLYFWPAIVMKSADNKVGVTKRMSFLTGDNTSSLVSSHRPMMYGN